MDTRVKQAIVIRRDLGMRRGKEIAQGAHASLAFLVKRVLAAGDGVLAAGDGVRAAGDGLPAAGDKAGEGWLAGIFTAAELAWMRGGSAKICLQVASEAELLAVHERAREAGLTVELIRDSGKTEFGGVPTLTCLAIGPDSADRIDPVTRDLKLY